MAGTFSGFIVTGVETGIRPTSERVRKSFFDIMRHRLPEMHMIDAFAGSGIMGFEALSRGAGSVVFIEQSKSACRRLKRQVSELQCGERARVICGDAGVHLAEAISLANHWIVFCDPPYRLRIMPEILKRIGEPMLKPRLDQVIIEHHHKLDPVGDTHFWMVHRREKYGETVLTFLQPVAG